MSTNLSCVHNLIQSSSSAPTTTSRWAASNTNIVDFGLTESANAFYVQAKSDNTDQFIVYNVPTIPAGDYVWAIHTGTIQDAVRNCLRAIIWSPTTTDKSTTVTANSYCALRFTLTVDSKVDLRLMCPRTAGQRNEYNHFLLCAAAEYDQLLAMTEQGTIVQPWFNAATLPM